MSREPGMAYSACCKQRLLQAGRIFVRRHRWAFEQQARPNAAQYAARTAPTMPSTGLSGQES